MKTLNFFLALSLLSPVAFAAKKSEMVQRAPATIKAANSDAVLNVECESVESKLGQAGACLMALKIDSEKTCYYVANGQGVSVPVCVSGNQLIVPGAAVTAK